MADDKEGSEHRGRLSLGLRLLANALNYTPAPISDTAAFRDLGHDADLLPRITRQLQRVLDGFHRDSNVVYDIQGRNDHGCDLLVRLTTDNGCQFVGFQVKSHIELLKEDVVSLLIRQYYDASQHYSPLLTFYIFLAADLSESGPQHRVVRAIQQRFSKDTNLRIITPQYASTFLRLPSTAMDALITQTMRSGDPVTTAAKGDLLSHHPVAAAILLRLVERRLVGVPHMHVDQLIADPWIQSVAEVTPDRSLRKTSFGRSIDQLFATENAYRTQVGLPAGQDLLAEYNAEEMNDDDELYPAYLDEFFDGISDSLRLYMLQPGKQVVADSAARLLQFLPNALDELSEDIEFLNDEGEYITVNLEDYMPLVAIMAEGFVKHQLVESDELISYVINLLLPAE